MRLTYPNFKKSNKKEEDTYLLIQIIWYTIIPMAITYLAIKIHPGIIVLTLMTLILRITRE